MSAVSPFLCLFLTWFCLFCEEKYKLVLPFAVKISRIQKTKGRLRRFAMQAMPVSSKMKNPVLP